ncbi:MAG: N-acetyl-gamma-glutamyl-phosphate reductase [Deltaproteobacteria bacterium]|nr:N-acetyl-gamma-glutamyl-phosphate reductase [Deltaproteobacteria bacterium]
MIRVGIVGATGYTGAELVRLLSVHPEIELKALTSRQYEGVRFDTVYPALAGVTDLSCEAFSADDVCDKTDFVFMALPHSLPMLYIPELISRGKKVVDLSADFRFNDPAIYESVYQPHSAKDLMKVAVYGLSEVYSASITSATLVGNPGCYPTSILLPLIPLLRNNLIDPNSIIADSKSGVSGAGRSLSLTTHFCEVNESFKAYKITTHRHTPEIEEVLSEHAGKPISISFVPHLLPMTRGMLSTIYVNLNKNVNGKNVGECLISFFANHPFVRIRPEDQPPDTLYVRGTNYCDIGLKMDERNNRMIIVSTIDNLIKGASGQAVQNMNIMLGLDETTGLTNPPFPI